MEIEKTTKFSNKILFYVVFFVVIELFNVGLFYLYDNTKNDTVIQNNTIVYESESLYKGIEKVYDSVVIIENYIDGELEGIGSGFIYDKEGYIMTNYHVIENADKLQVVLSNDKTLTPTIIGKEEYEDIAILKIDESEVLSVATLGNSTSSKIGDTVFTIGSPIDGSFYGSVTKGIISAKNRLVSVAVSSKENNWMLKLIQTDASINPGNSGGPLCNIAGEVIGINVMKIEEDNIEGIGFAIPIEEAKKYADAIVEGKEIKKSYLGISMSSLENASAYIGRLIDENTKYGVFVAKVTANGPCEKAGLQIGDVIIQVNDINIKTVAELRYYISLYEPNTEINLTYMRKDEKITTKVVLGEN